MGLSLSAKAQDPVFTQFNLNKNYLNPAYAGYTSQLNVGFNTRRQWTNLPGVFNTNTVNANIGCAPSRIGIGFVGYDHTEGEGYLNHKSATGQVAVHLPSRLPRWMGRKLAGRKTLTALGLGIGAGQKSIDWEELTFTDQFSAYDGYLGSPSQAHLRSNVSNVIFDLSAGMRSQIQLNKKGTYLSLGAGIFHLNRPVETFFNMDNRLQPRYTVHVFNYFQIKRFANEPDYLSVGMILDHQQGLKTNTLLVSKDVGSFAKVSVGFRRQNFVVLDENTDAIILQGLFSFSNFTLGYSYDMTISRLGSQRTWGTHEIGINYTFKKLSLCTGKRGGSKDEDDCFFLMEDIDPAFRDQYLWNM